MKRYRVGFSRVAEAQVDTIEIWWRENRPAAPEMFLSELDAAVRLLETSPMIGKRYPEEPQSGIRGARFHLWPWKKIELEKINPGA